MTKTLSIDPAALEQLTHLCPPYVQEILLESRMNLSWEAKSGFVFQVLTKTRNQLLILLKEESVIALLKALTQFFQPDTLRLSHQGLHRNIPVQDFLSFAG